MATKKKRGIPFYWTRDDEKMGKLVVEKYAISSEEELLAMFPGQNMKSIGKAANKRGVKRRRKNSWVPEQEKLLSEYFPKSHDENLSDDERNKLKVELTEKINAISVKEGLTTKSWRDSILTKAIQMGHSWARNKSSGAVGKKIGNSLEEKFIAWLKKATRSIEEISEFLEIPTTKCYEFIDKLRSEGFPVETDDDKRTFFWREGVDQDGTTKLPPLSRKTFKLVVFTDPRLGHKSQQLTLLHNLYSFINRGYVNKERGIDFSDINMVVCLGNLVAGKTQRKGDSNLFLTEFEDQIDYVIDHFPVLKDGIKTYCLNGPAEFDLGKGSAKRLTRNTLQAICVARNDMVYAGDLNHTFTITGTDIKIFGDHSPGLHSPSPYTRSIPLDYLTSSFDDLSPRRRGEKPPVVTVVGGYHVPMYFPPINADSNRHAFLVSSFCDPQASSRDRKKQGSAATIGFTVITVALNENRKKVEKVLYQEHSWTNHQITDDYLTVPEYKNLSEDEDKILKGFYREGSLREGEIARRIGKSKTEARRVVKSLKRRGIDISTLDSASNSYILERRQKRSWGPSKDMKKFTRKVYAKTVDVGAYSDSHCGSIFEQPHVFREIEQIFTEAGVKIIYHSGDVHEGEDLFRGQPRTLYLHTSEEQREH
ncbi:MAG: hypothetical protein U9P90_02410, partial [Patescibacteria group bacterium]|nr:hypothetical protein [Patescibacteria group bacterium]